MAKRSKKKRAHRTPVGDVPGTLIASPSSHPTEVNLVSYTENSLREESFHAVKDADLFPQGGTLWLDIEGLADTETIARIGLHFGIHSLAMEDVLYNHQPKAEDFGAHLQILFPTLADPQPTTELVSMFIGKNFVLTFQAGLPQDPFTPVRERLRQARGQIRTRGSDYLAYALIDSAIDAYFPLVDTWSDQLARIELTVMTHPTTELWDEICDVRTKVLSLRRTLRRFREAIVAILSYESSLIALAHRPYFNDLQDHLIELTEELDELRETTGELMGTFHARQAQRTNDIMQVLTIISTIFIPLSFVAGVYGMNFDRASRYNMPELGWAYGYPFALALMAAIGGAFLFYFWKKGWLGRKGLTSNSQRS